jgi:ankyrin repeat protein
VVGVLLDQGANADARRTRVRETGHFSSFQYTTNPLFVAIPTELIEIVRSLLDHGADANARQCFSITMIKNQQRGCMMRDRLGKLKLLNCRLPMIRVNCWDWIEISVGALAGDYDEIRKENRVSLRRG